MPCLSLSLAFLAFITLYPRERFIRQNGLWLSVGGFKIKATFTNEIMLSIFLIFVRTHDSCKISSHPLASLANCCSRELAQGKAEILWYFNMVK